ncbi:hypothetical protein [Streptomyces sp. NPDC057002]|uniref:hypothetical protein n=1 Tax=Streptomyces sp. NPDC057002 TaxID=3345992 RepID=UPI00364390CD
MIILDTSAVVALAQGRQAIHRLVDNVAHTPGDWLHMPALCLMPAESMEKGTAGDVIALPEVMVDPLHQTAAATVGSMTVTAGDIDSSGMLGFLWPE